LPVEYIFSNQYTGYLFIDIINVFAENHKCKLYTGHLDPMKTQLAPDVEIRFLKRYNKKTTIKRIYTWMTYTLQVFFRLLFIKKNSELVLVTNPPLVPVLGYFFKKIRGIKYHLVIYDVYPDALVNFSFISEDGMIKKMWSKVNAKLFKQANTIFTLSEGMAALIKKYNPEVKVEVIKNWADTLLIKPLPKSDNPFALKYEQLDKITVMYSGNMGSTHAVEKVADLAFALKDDRSFNFILIGDGAKKPILEKIKAEKNLDNFLVLPYQEPAMFPYSISCADLGVVTLSAGAESLSVPSKTYNLLAAGTALFVISPPTSELAKLVNEYYCGVAFEENEMDKMCAFLNEIKRDRAYLIRMKENARKASANFTTENAKQYKIRLNSNVSVS
jgi:glycosyltransferase involved in cell wall biosynthesis